MATSPSASSASSSLNPFADPNPPAITASTIQHVHIRTHVPLILDYGETTYSIWSAFFDATFRKFGLLDHVDGSVDPQTMWHNAEWLQIDQCIVSWLYNSVTTDLMKMIHTPNPTALSLWLAIRGLFLDNADQRAVYAFQEFHSLFQGDMSIHDYFARLKELSDLLRDVGHPVSQQSMVVNALRGLNSKFSHAISVITAYKPLPTFHFTRDYLLREESRQVHTARMEAASALLAAGSASAPAPPRAPAPSPPPPPTSSSPTKPGNDRRKKRKQTDNRRGGAGGSTSSPAGGQASFGAGVNPWTGVVQAWPMSIWRPSSPSLLGPAPSNASQQALTASSFAPIAESNSPQQHQLPAGLLAALHSVPAPSQYQGGGDWVMDTGASSHMANNNGFQNGHDSTPM